MKYSIVIDLSNKIQYPVAYFTRINAQKNTMVCPENRE